MLALNIAGSNPGLIVVAAGREGVLADEFRKSGTPFHILRRRLPIDPLYVLRLHHLTKKYKVEIIHAHQLPEALNAVILSIFTGVKIFFTYHGFRIFGKYRPLKSLFLILLKRLRGSLFVSNYLSDFYCNQLPGKIKNPILLYNGIRITGQNEHEKRSLREEFNIPVNALILGMTANFSEARDHMLVLRALRLLPKEINGKPLHLMLIGKRDKGESPLYNSAVTFVMKNSLSERVHFAGPRNNAASLATKFDLFVYASHRETFSLSVVEAIMAGVPVAVNDFPVLDEVTLNGELANLYESGDEEALARLVEGILSDLPAYKSRATANAITARKLYSIETHIENLLAIYQK